MKDYFLGYEHGYKAGLKLGFIVAGVVLAIAVAVFVHIHLTTPTINCPSHIVYLDDQGHLAKCLPIDKD